MVSSAAECVPKNLPTHKAEVVRQAIEGAKRPAVLWPRLQIHRKGLLQTKSGAEQQSGTPA